MPDLESKTKLSSADTLGTPDPWQSLGDFTDARIGLGRTGGSLPTRVQLKFNLDHALARDAVNTPLDLAKVQQELQATGISSEQVHSQAVNRQQYLQRPDLGRRLNQASVDKLVGANKPVDVALVLADGLSSMAVQSQGAALATAIVETCMAEGLSTSPVILVEQARVAVGDEIGELLQAQSVVLIVGERPGLSSPDSLGIYYTYQPKVGLTDVARNCISNIRPAGLSIKQAAEKTLWLVRESIKLKLSGVELKDTTDDEATSLSQRKTSNFLLP